MQFIKRSLPLFKRYNTSPASFLQEKLPKHLIEKASKNPGKPLSVEHTLPWASLTVCVISLALVIKSRFSRTAKVEATELEKLKEPTPGKPSIVLVSCGSFNPPTNLHLQLLEGTKDHLEKTQNSDVVLGIMSPVHDAYDICTKDSKWISIDPWEAKQDKYSTTVTVLRHVDEEVKRNVVNPDNVRVMLVCGADLLESFNRPGLWATEDQEEILTKFGVCVLERGGLNLGELIYGNDIMFKHMKNIHIVPNLITNDISSTKIRQFVKRGYSIKYLCPKGIPEYIEHFNLYQ